MRLREIQVDGLFGIFDHRVPLGNSDPVTIIHGPNGYGKTVLLEMIHEFLNGRTEIFERIPFKEFRILYDDSSIVRVVKRLDGNSDAEASEGRITTILCMPDGTETVMSEAPSAQLPSPVPGMVLDYADRFVPSRFHRVSKGWRDASTGEFLSFDRIARLYPRILGGIRDEFHVNVRADVYAGPTPVPPTFFIETRRLTAEHDASTNRSAADVVFFPDASARSVGRPEVELRVEEYSADIVRRIRISLAEYAKFSQERDRSFPERLVAFMREKRRALPESDIVEKMGSLEEKRQRLIALGFLDQESGLTNLTEEDVRRAAAPLTIYVDDVDRKLSAFDVLAGRVGKLIDIVNLRYKYKKLAVQREAGFSLKTDLGQALALGSLSSGEQHELIVLYELLFRAPEDGLVLVDEPEISLHVAWQTAFLSDLIAILKLSRSYAIVATHSPIIIGDRWDLTQDLQGPRPTS